jgi:capsular polysaccharide export protein
MLSSSRVSAESRLDNRLRPIVPDADRWSRAPTDERRFVFVTAPFGPFSRRLAKELRARGARCKRVLVNGGDVLDWGLREAAVYRGGPADWSRWIADYFTQEQATDLIIHGSAYRHANQAAVEARRLGMKVHVFEEGYFRPHWVTLERDGVNCTSSLPKDPQVFRKAAAHTRMAPFVPAGKITPAGVKRLIAHHLSLFLASPLFPRFRAPYRYSITHQCRSHIQRYVSQAFTAGRTDRVVQALLADPRPIFLALLQRPGDAQLTHDANFSEMRDFIDHVVNDFAQNAPADTRLCFKAHPLDHGIEPNETFVRNAAAAAGVSDRVTYVDGGHFPTMVRAAVGVISVNSTGGLSALEAGRPTIALGRAIYTLPGLTHQAGLGRFWTAPEEPDASLLVAFRAVVMAQTQINGDFSTPAGIALVAPEAARRMMAAQ